MRLKYGLLCDYASPGMNGKPVIVHVFDFMGIPAPIEPGDPLLLPLCYIALSLEATPFEHGNSEITIRLVDADGKEGGTWTMPTSFRAPMPGYPAQAGLFLPVTGLAVPDFGEYLFEILWGTQRIGEIRFSVFRAEVAPPPVVS